MRMSSHAAVCESSNNGIETGPCYIKDLHDSHGRVIVRQTILVFQHRQFTRAGERR